MMYRAVLFDFDGTLADTKEDVWLSLEYAAKQVGGTLPTAFRANSANLACTEEEIFSALTPTPPTERLEAFCAAVKHHYRKLNSFTNTRLFAGIAKLLEQCQTSGIPCYIITNKPAEPMQKLLLTKGWNSLFQGVLSPDSFPGEERRKADLIHYTLESLLKHKDAVYIGDTDSDVYACRENSLDCIGVLYGDGDPSRVRAAEPNHLANSPEAVFQILFGVSE